eukprot:gene17565-22201_t
MRVIYEALKTTKGAGGGDALLAAMKGQIFESPRGKVFIDAQTRDIVQDVYLRKVERVNGQLYNVEFDVIKDVKDPDAATLRCRPSLRRQARSRGTQPPRGTPPARRGDPCAAAAGLGRASIYGQAPSRSVRAGPVETGGRSDFMLTILFDGVAYGMLLFILAGGWAGTMARTNFINL